MSHHADDRPGPTNDDDWLCADISITYGSQLHWQTVRSSTRTVDVRQNCRNVSIRRRTVFPNVPYNPTQSGFVATRCFDKSNGSNLPSSDLSIRCFPTPKLRTKNKHVRLSQFRQMDIFCHTAIFTTITSSFRTNRLYVSDYVSRIGFGQFFLADR